jgi:hypothetical protein
MSINRCSLNRKRRPVEANASNDAKVTIMSAHATPSPSATATGGEAEAVMGRLLEAMDALVAMIEQETALVREGRLSEAALIDRAKSDFARSYVSDMARLAAGKAALTTADPNIAEAFRRRHAEFQELLQTNLIVLATAHTVTEDLIRGVSGELARKAAPQTYSASGRPSGPSASTIQPLAVSRSL